MSDRYSGNRCNQPYCSDQNVLTGQMVPFAFNNYSDPSAINGRGEHLLLQHINYFIPKSPPSPTTNLRIGMWGRGGAKAYYRFHGGIGDGRGSIGCRANEDTVAARPLQLFDSLDPVDFQIDMIKKAADHDGFVKNPVTGTEATAGTGVFLPVYPSKPTTGWRWIPSTKVLNNNGDKSVGDCRSGDDRGRARGYRTGGGHGDEKKKQEDSFKKHFEEEVQHKDLDEIPIEQLLPSEWTY